MRTCWSILCACAVLAAGSAFTSAELTPLDEVTVTSGGILPTRVQTIGYTVESCFLVTPRRESIKLVPGDLSNDKYELQPPTLPLYGCQVTIRDLDGNDNGIWELYFTADGVKQGSQYYNVTVMSDSNNPVSTGDEEVRAVPSDVKIAEGSDLHVRLEKPTTMHDSCLLIGPSRHIADRDRTLVDTCGFIVRNLTRDDDGFWAIRYVTDVKRYVAYIHVHVTVNGVLNHDGSRVWTKNSPLNDTFGPEDTIFCKVEDPSGRVVFEGFGRCNIVVDRVRENHAGVWKTTIGRSGRVVTETTVFTVNVVTASKAQVMTSVVTEKPVVTLTCQVVTEYDVTACKFRTPAGKVLLVSAGVGEGRYSYYGNGINGECGLRITDPLVEDLGLWRCGVETDVDTYYGFLSVICPWAMMDPAVAAVVVTEPVLTAEVESMSSVEGDAVTMRCSVQSSIRYCYFRHQNGSIWNVSPGGSEWFEYAGAGLDAGECSIRFPALRASDSGRWGCHVGFEDQAELEQRAQMELHVEEQMFATQYHLEDSHHTLVVHSQVHNHLPLEYCRFVRMDGNGFTSENLPQGYENHSHLSSGACEIRIRSPSILEQHPWEVVARVAGRASELARTTTHSISMPGEPDDGPLPRGSNFAWVFSSVVALFLAFLLLGVLLCPTRNRQWVYRRASSVRSSFRASLFKKPLPVEHQDVQTGRGNAMAA